MRSTINRRLLYGATVLAAGAMFFFTSCTERYVEGSGNGGNASMSTVRVPLQWPDPSNDTLGLPSKGMKYVFLPASVSVSTVSHSSAGFYSHFQGALPVGNYSLLVYTSGVSGLTLVDDMQFDKAAVCAVPVASGEEGATVSSNSMIAACGRFWGASLGGVSVPAAGITTATVQPLSLTSQIRLQVQNHTTVGIDSISGVFRGLVQSRLLRNGQPVSSTARSAYAFGSSVVQTKASNATFSSVFRTLGVYDPLSTAHPYSNVLTLTAWLSNGKQITTDIDISTKIHDALSATDAGVNAALNTAVELGIVLDAISGNGIDTTVTVKAWEDGGEIWQDI